MAFLLWGGGQIRVIRRLPSESEHDLITARTLRLKPPLAERWKGRRCSGSMDLKCQSLCMNIRFGSLATGHLPPSRTRRVHWTDRDRISRRGQISQCADTGSLAAPVCLSESLQTRTGAL